MPYALVPNPDSTIVTVKNHSYYIVMDEPNYGGVCHYLSVVTDCQGKVFQYDICGKDPQVATESNEIMTTLAKIC